MDDLDLQDLERVVASRFPVYESRYDPLEGVAVFLVTVDDEHLGGDFNELKQELEAEGYIPMLREEGGEHIVYVVQAPEQDYTKQWVNLALFLATVVTTITAGALIVHSYENPGATGLGTSISAMISPVYLAKGALLFSLPLMGILGVHELGHYFTARYYGIEASLPFFIPIPPLIGVPLGTMGAFISIRRPITDRKALLDIGIAGPLAGLVVAIPVVMIGAYLGAIDPQFMPADVSPENILTLGGPVLGFLGGPQVQGVLFRLLTQPFPAPADAIIHPTAFAGWVGLLVTGLNLLPAGQLDGGHIFRAALGESHKYVSMAAVGALLFFGIEFQGWLVFALLVLVLGTYHPPPLNDITELPTSRKALAVAAFALLLLTFVPVPFSVPG